MDDLGPLPKLHPRFDVVRQASQEIEEHWYSVKMAHKLTYAERFLILAELVRVEAANAVKLERRRDQPEAEQEG